MWTYMFFKLKLGLNKEKSLFTSSLFNPLYSPSPIPHLIIISRIYKISGALIVIMFFCRLLFQKSGTKSRGVLHFVPLRRFYAVFFIPLFCRLREKCGTLWKTTWLHNVDNIRQKDIKYVKREPNSFSPGETHGPVGLIGPVALCNVQGLPIFCIAD